MCADAANGGNLMTPWSSLGKFVFGKVCSWKGELEVPVIMFGKEGSTVFLLSMLYIYDILCYCYFPTNASYTGWRG